MQKSTKKDRFIRLRKTDLIQECLDDGRLTSKQQNEFWTLWQLIVSRLQFDYHKNYWRIRRQLYPFDINPNTLTVTTLSDDILKLKQDNFVYRFP